MKSRWFIVAAPRHEPALRLFCLPFAGGNASTYTAWARELDPSIELVAVQPPGRANRIGEPPHESMEAMVFDFASAVQPWLDRPYALFGHSLGSRVGFEFIHLAAARGWRLPEHFFLSGSLAPHVDRRHKRVSHLSDAEFLQALAQFDSPTAALLNEPRLVQLFMPLLRADFLIADTYARAPGQRLRCPISVYCGTEDFDAPESGMDAWQLHFDQPIKVQSFPGGHFFINSSAGDVIAAVDEVLREILSRVSRPVVAAH